MADENILAEIRAVAGKGQAKSDFMANRALVRAALEGGHPKMAIWRVLHQKHEFRASYRQFLKYVADLLPPAQPPTVAPPTRPPTITKVPVPEGKPTFKFDPFKPDILKVGLPTASPKAP